MSDKVIDLHRDDNTDKEVVELYKASNKKLSIENQTLKQINILNKKTINELVEQNRVLKDARDKLSGRVNFLERRLLELLEKGIF